MSDVKMYAVKHRGDEKPNGEGHYWDETGLTLFVKQTDDGPRLWIKDGRTGQNYSCFRIERKQDGGQQQRPRQQPQQGGFEDDIPF